jgi:UDP-glucose-4-epimerase GalE
VSGKIILVTGGGGYVGSHACKALAAAGYTPVTYDNFIRGHRDFVKWGPLEEGDICDGEGLLAVMKKYSPHAVMHFAALALVGESITESARYFRTNADGTATLVGAMAQAGIKRLIVSGTCAVYGIPASTPIAEDAPKAPINPYGESKLRMEEIIAKAGETHGLAWTVLRYFNAAGADPDGEIGERHDPETHLIPNVLRAVAGRQPLNIFGDDYPTPDGTCIRDYVHVSDIAAAHVAALGYLDSNPGGYTFNLGNGTGFSVREVIAAVQRITGKQIPMTIAPRRPGDPAVLIADPSRARQILRWTPKRSSLDDQVSDAWNWFRENG